MNTAELFLAVVATTNFLYTLKVNDEGGKLTDFSRFICDVFESAS